MIPNLEKWQGEKLEKGDKLLVISEQGLGDTIQFMRYVKFLTEKNIDISFCAQEKLKGLIISSKITSVSFNKQRKLTKEIKKAKILGLI